jgi:hypothetical protein
MMIGLFRRKFDLQEISSYILSTFGWIRMLFFIADPSVFCDAGEQTSNSSENVNSDGIDPLMAEAVISGR